MARDKYHEAVKQALIKEGWTVTHDPLIVNLPEETKNVAIDLGAEKILAAEKGEVKIAVEIKSFLRISQLTSFYKAIGQFTVYAIALAENESDRVLYLAVPHVSWLSFFKRPIARLTIERTHIKILVYDKYKNTIIQWIE